MTSLEFMTEMTHRVNLYKWLMRMMQEFCDIHGYKFQDHGLEDTHDVRLVCSMIAGDYCVEIGWCNEFDAKSPTISILLADFKPGPEKVGWHYRENSPTYEHGEMEGGDEGHWDRHPLLPLFNRPNITTMPDRLTRIMGVVHSSLTPPKP